MGSPASSPLPALRHMLNLRTTTTPQTEPAAVPAPDERGTVSRFQTLFPAPPPDATAAHVSGSRLGAALLVYMLGVTLIITLLPFRFQWPAHWRVMWTGNVIDVVGNVLLFVPLGLLYRMATRFSSRHAVMRALAAGLLVSMGIELLQLFEVDRFTSVLDVVTNGAGAVVGALAFDRLARDRDVDARWVGRLFLELPLMGLIYLTVPLLWLTALAATVAPAWGWLALPLAAHGGMLLGGTVRHLSVPGAAPFSSQRVAAFAAAGVVAGMFPAIVHAPLAVIASAGVAFGVTHLAAGTRSRRPAWNRRFEVPVLRSAAPFYALFVVLLVLLPLAGGVAPFSLGVGFGGAAGSWDKAEILRFLVRLAALTLLGYMVAEYRGREEKRLEEAFPRVLHWTLGAATSVVGAMGYVAGRGTSVAQWVLLVVAGLYGGWLYRLQRDYVVSLRGEPAETDPPPTDL